MGSVKTTQNGGLGAKSPC